MRGHEKRQHPQNVGLPTGPRQEAVDLDDGRPYLTGPSRVASLVLQPFTASLETNGFRVFANLAAGDHTLELSELTVDCRVTGNNPRTVTAVAGTARYEISVDDGLFSEPIGPGDELTLFPVPVGVHTVTLTPVRRDCQLVGSNPRIVIIRQAGGFGGTIFKVHCPQ